MNSSAHWYYASPADAVAQGIKEPRLEFYNFVRNLRLVKLGAGVLKGGKCQYRKTGGLGYEHHMGHWVERRRQ